MVRGHIRKRGKDSWTIVLSMGHDPATGKRRQQWVSVKGTKKDAERKLSELLHQVDRGEFLKPTKNTLADFLEQWLSIYVAPNLSPRTAEGYSQIIHGHLIPALGNILLGELKPEHLQRYYSEKLSSGRIDGKGGLSHRTIRHHHVTLHDALQHAVKWGLIGRNPADAVESPRYQTPERKILDENDVRILLSAAQSTPYYALFYMALFTGMRRSELLALRWDDIDLDLAQISVSRTLHQLSDRTIVFRPPKTAKGRRTIALPPSAALVLREHREKQELAGCQLGKTVGEYELVFSKPDGTPLLPDAVTHAWIKLVRRAGFSGVRFHDARHSHASLMLKAGVHPKIVQERLGHASIQITLDTYSHITPGLQAAAAERFDECFRADQTPTANTVPGKTG